MLSSINIFSEINWHKSYKNPVEMTDLIGVFIDNHENFKISLWVCLDHDVYIRVSDKNADKLIRYIYQRYPS